MTADLDSATTADRIHYVPDPGADYICACGWDVQDLPEGHSYTTEHGTANCKSCEVMVRRLEEARADERQRIRLGHELRMGPFHVVCCFNEVEQRDPRLQ